MIGDEASIISLISVLSMTGSALLITVFILLKKRSTQWLEFQKIKQYNGLLQERLQFLQKCELEVDQMRFENQRLSHENVQFRQTIQHDRASYQEKLNVYQNLQQQVNDSLKNLTQQALLSNNNAFLNLAKGTFEQLMETTKLDFNQRQQNMNLTLEPIQKALSQVDEKLHLLEKERLSAYVDIRRQVQDMVNTQNQLKNETANLVKALRTPTSRGQWGEIQLKRVVEMSGMLSHCDFFEQKTSGDGKLRPDLVIHLPGNKNIVVDAKTALSAYLHALEADNEEKRIEFLTQHAQQVRAHVKILSQKAYWDQFQPSPEFVVMFLPGESFFSAALERDPSLIEVGVREKVILATPTTLIALLRAVSYGWRQESLTENARLVSELGRELYKRLGDMTSHLGRLGRHVGQVVDTYNQTVGTFERRVLVSARRMTELDSLLDKDQMESPILLDSSPRNIQPMIEKDLSQNLGENDEI